MKKLTAAILSVLMSLNLAYAEECVKKVQLKYISPGELIESLNLAKNSTDGYKLGIHGSVAFMRINSANNQIMVGSDSVGIQKAIDLINFMDVPPRQIIIEAKIIEIDNQKVRETGFDWQNLLDNSRISMAYNSDMNSRTDKQTIDGIEGSERESDQTNKAARLASNITTPNVGDLIKIIEDKNVGTVTNIPKIVTINNKTGKILDGNRITYVTRYSSYSNLYETQELTTGLSLEVTPSIGESGYLKLAVQAKLTSLGAIIGDSPSESGQILENTVIAKNKESFLLGAFKQTENRKIKRKVPLLGTILPFLFSRDVTVEATKDMLIILTPEIIDLNAVNVPKLQTTED